MAVVGKCAMHLRLIDAVRDHEVLYNCDLKDYSDNILKMRLWRLIARKCDIESGDEAKKIWKNLRDGYRCSLKTLKIYEKKEPPRPLKPWKYVDEMEFLRPFMKDRIFTNVAYYEGYSVDFVEKAQRLPAVLKAADEQSNDDGDAADLQEEIECRPDVSVLAQQELLNQLQQYDDAKAESVAQITSDLTSQAMSQLEALASIYPHISVGAPPPQPPPPAPAPPPNGVGPKKRGRKRKVRHEPLAASPTPQSPAAPPPPPPPLPPERLPNTVDNGDVEDSLKLFFDSMYATARTLPAPLQRLVRIKLFQTVTDAEMAAESMAMEMLPQGAFVYNAHPPKQDSPSD